MITEREKTYTVLWSTIFLPTCGAKHGTVKQRSVVPRRNTSSICKHATGFVYLQQQRETLNFGKTCGVTMATARKENKFVFEITSNNLFLLCKSLTV